MAISFSRPDPASPAAVSAASFNVSRRGFDQSEVRDFLRMVSAELARLQERERFLESELKAMQTRGMSGPGMLDEELVTTLLGEEAARVLGTAREASAQIRQRAEESATRLVKEASSDAARLREEAEIEAVRRREDAAADAEAEIELAKQQGRDMVGEAREYREKILTELARRRELAREQIEQLIHNRDRILNAFERARLATDDVMTGLVSVDQDLPREYVNLAPTTGPVPTVVFNPRNEKDQQSGEVVHIFDHATMPEVEPVVEVTVVEITVVEDTIVEIEDTIVEVTVEEDTIVEITVIEDTVVEVTVVEVTIEEKSNVVSLFSKGRPRPEAAVVVNSEHPSIEKVSDTIVHDSVSAAPPASDTVGSLFARLREGTVDKVSEKTLESSPEKATKKSARNTKVVSPVVDAGAFTKRDEALAPLVVAMSRKLKRVLADEENEVLEYLRGKKNSLSLDAMFGESNDHIQRYVVAIVDEVMVAAKAGAKSATEAKVLPAVCELVNVQIVAPLRHRLGKVLHQNPDDRVALAKSMRGVYRQWKTAHIDEHVDDIACLSYSRAVYVSIKPGTQVCWMVDPNGPDCPDAEDNSLAGCVALGDDFPTGHAHPLAHEGCRCLLTVAPQ